MMTSRRARGIDGRYRLRTGLLAAGLSAVAIGGLLVPGGAASAAPHGGVRTTLRGVYTVVHGDANPEQHRYANETRYFLRTSTHAYKLHFSVIPHVLPQTTVSATGWLQGDTLDVGNLEAPNGAMSSLAPPQHHSTTGTKKVLAILTQWSGGPISATQSGATSFLFGSDSRTVKSWYLDASYGQLTWAGDVTPVLTIAARPETCDLYGLAAAAETAATSAGYTLSNYDAEIIDAPNLYCPAAGYGEIGGIHTWVQDGLYNLGDGYSRLVPTHEIGHSLGLYHSHGLDCGSATITTACLGSSSSNEEYGNAWDVMGNNWPGDGSDAVAWFSAKQEMNLGWLPSSAINHVSSSGTYSISPLEQSSPASPRVLVITTANHEYYVEFRQAIGQDAFLSGYPASTNGVQISMRDDLPGGDAGPTALDFTPNSAGEVYYDWYDAPLATGSTFNDIDNAFSLKPTSTAGGVASVTVTFNSTAKPVASLGSASVYEGDAGTHTVEFPVTLSAPASSPVTVHYKVFHGSGDTAAAGSDFVAATGTLLFKTAFAGKTGTVQSIPVTIKGDTTKESNERYSVQLTSVSSSATLGVSLSHGNILNDDKGSGVRLTVSNVSIVEGNQVATVGGSNYVNFHIHLSKPVPSGKTVKVTYHTVAGSATGGSAAGSGIDFLQLGTTTVTFTSGQSDKTVQVRVFADSAHESNETFSLAVSSATNASLQSKTGTGTIVNDD